MPYNYASIPIAARVTCFGPRITEFDLGLSLIWVRSLSSRPIITQSSMQSATYTHLIRLNHAVVHVQLL